MERDQKSKQPPAKMMRGGGGERRRIVLFEDLDRPLPIDRVIVGPSTNQQESARHARDVLGDRVEIALSETPYVPRTWGKHDLEADSPHRPEPA